MSRALDATTREPLGRRGASAAAQLELGLLVVWAADPHHVGEVMIVPEGPARTLGRGSLELLPFQQRPGENQPRIACESPFLSRAQATVRVVDRAISVHNQGRCPLLDEHGEEVPSLTVEPGQLFGFGEVLLFMVVQRTATMSVARSSQPSTWRPFAEADAGGIVGESPVTWALRDELAFLAARNVHVLILGPSGTGKELAARAIHAASARADKRLVARNAATLPSGLIEAELFGNAPNYPHHGMPERPGLVGEADGSTLFLDEIGELPEELQTRLLRLLDEGAEYHRLGDARRRRANVRVLAATNRPIESLRHDIAARFNLRLTLPSLDDRREDIPLLARHIVRRIGASDPAIAERFFERGEPRFSPALVRALLARSYEANIRELETLLWSAIVASHGNTIEATAEMIASSRATSSKVPSLEEVRAALERHNGVQERVWRDLGLANRHVLARLVRKYGLGAKG